MNKPCQCACCCKREKDKWTFGLEALKLETELKKIKPAFQKAIDCISMFTDWRSSVFPKGSLIRIVSSTDEATVPYASVQEGRLVLNEFKVMGYRPQQLEPKPRGRPLGFETPVQCTYCERVLKKPVRHTCRGNYRKRKLKFKPYEEIEQP